MSTTPPNTTGLAPIAVPDLPALTPEELTVADLPVWMRPRYRRIDWGLLLIIAFALISALPLLTRAGLPRDNYAILYAYRSLEVAESIKAGVLYSRWAADFHYTYGSPLFNFIAPLPHYLPGYHQAFTEANPMTSIRLFMALSVLGAGAGMYLFVQRRWGALAGIIAALMYLYSPPLALTLPYIVGELALLMALALLPLFLWALDRLRSDGRGFNTILAVLVGCAYLLSDTRIVVLSFPIIAWGVLTIPGSGRVRRRASAVIAAAVLISAFFWLPALLERNSLRWVSAPADPPLGAIPLTEAFATLRGYEPTILNPAPSRSIGMSAWLLTLGGIAALLAMKKPADRGSLTILTLIGLVLIVSASETFAPLLYPSVQDFAPIQPYHAALMALVCFCLISAQIGHWLQQQDDVRWRIAGTVGVCLLPLLTALPAVYPPTWNVLPTPTLLTMLGEELAGYHAGSLREGILLPSTAQIMPAPPPRLLQDLQDGAFSRIPRGSLSGETRLDAVFQGPTQSQYTLVSERPIRLTLAQFNWLGWTANFDGSPLPTTTSIEGMLRMSLPADRGNVVVSLGATPVRDAAWALSFAGGILTILLLRSRARWSGTIRNLALRREEVLMVTVILIGWAGLTVWIRAAPELISSTQEQQSIAPLRRFWQGGIDLLGYALPDPTLRRGGQFTVTVYWGAARPIVGSYQSQILLVNSTGRIVAAEAHRHPGGIPALRWTVNRVVRDEFHLVIPALLPDGQYRLRIRLSACNLNQMLPCGENDLQALEATDELGRSVRGAVTIPQVLRVQSH